MDDAKFAKLMEKLDAIADILTDIKEDARSHHESTDSQLSMIDSSLGMIDSQLSVIESSIGLIESAIESQKD